VANVEGGEDGEREVTGKKDAEVKAKPLEGDGQYLKAKKP